MRGWRSQEKRITGFLDQGADLTGELQFSGVVRIDGNFHGSIVGGDSLIVGENAVIHADVQAREIEIRGQVCGNIEAGNRIEIHSSGRLTGNLKTCSLVILAGGVVNGQIQMFSDPSVGKVPILESTRIVSKGASRRTRSLDNADERL